MPRAISAASIAARTSAAVRPGRVARHAGRVRGRGGGRRQAQLVARGVVVMQAQVDDRVRERRIEHVDDPAADVAAEQAALLETGLDVGRGQRRDGAPANARRQARQRADRDSRSRRAISSGVGGSPSHSA